MSMLPNPANPQTDEPPGDIRPKGRALVPGLVSIGVTMVIAVLAHRFNKKAEKLPITSVSPGEANLQDRMPPELATSENRATDLPSIIESKASRSSLISKTTTSITPDSGLAFYLWQPQL
jgi:hypothetical protein